MILVVTRGVRVLDREPTGGSTRVVTDVGTCVTDVREGDCVTSSRTTGRGECRPSKTCPVPEPAPEWVRIKVMTFG